MVVVDGYTISSVAPLAGAWIEMLRCGCCVSAKRVAPLAGAWIEIQWAPPLRSPTSGRPPRGGVD